ncbi:hypothetical protein [Chryseolinea sp. H1M3-3]|uniref:hypothetical protein n=1 Tax=Chryseolinea sp. H1M3-3 TaxID=3034144 RepID=UPI0023EC2D31|nr:hypothetical protein [Chryseolinea sp. H1M3-3]
MSIIKYTTVELSSIVKEADLILQVAYLERYTEEVPVKSVDPSKPAPPFEKKGFVFSVKNILKNAKKIDVPPTIRVPVEEWRRSLGQYKERYANGASKSYIVKKYETSSASLQKATILFLHHFQGVFELEVKGSFESEEALEKITILIDADKD